MGEKYRDHSFDYFFFQRVFSRQCLVCIEESKTEENVLMPINKAEEVPNKIAKKALDFLENSFRKDLIKNEGLGNFVYSQYLENKLLNSSHKLMGAFFACSGIVSGLMKYVS